MKKDKPVKDKPVIENPFTDPRRIHAFINIDGGNPLDKAQSEALAELVRGFIEEKIPSHAHGHVWVRTSGD